MVVHAAPLREFGETVTSLAAGSVALSPPVEKSQFERETQSQGGSSKSTNPCRLDGIHRRREPSCLHPEVALFLTS
jgi:hypothetical protein